jgi:hypothetical protein
VSEYRLVPHATTSPFEPVVVALVAATTKTVLQVATPSTTDIRILSWGVSFDASAAAQPGWCQLCVVSYAATVTAMTPETWGNPLAPASLCVSGTTASGYNASGEGTAGTFAQDIDTQHVYPQSGYAVWFPQTVAGNSPRVAPSSFLRIRCKFPAGVNVIPWVVWAEPAV